MAVCSECGNETKSKAKDDTGILCEKCISILYPQDTFIPFWERLDEEDIPHWLDGKIRGFRRNHHTYIVRGRHYEYEVRTGDGGIYPIVHRRLR